MNEVILVGIAMALALSVASILYSMRWQRDSVDPQAQRIQELERQVHDLTNKLQGLQASYDRLIKDFGITSFELQKRNAQVDAVLHQNQKYRDALAAHNIPIPSDL